MNTHHFTSPKPRTITQKEKVSPGWWALAIGALIFFAVAIWFLTRTAG